MAVLSDYAVDHLLDALFRDVAYTSTHTYVALYTTAPSAPGAGDGVEVSGGSYVREQLDTLLAAAAAHSISNNTTITWPQATASWGTIVAVGIYDALTVGNELAMGPLAANKTIGSGDTFDMPATDLAISIG